MKKLTDMLREMADELPDYIIIELDLMALSDDDIFFEGLLNEGIWKPSKYPGYQYRLDQPANDTQKTHVHIAKNKHVKTKTKQVSWNDDGTRHDKKTFDVNFDGMNKAKEIARKTLGLSDEAILEQQNVNTKSLLLENVKDIPADMSFFLFKA